MPLDVPMVEILWQNPLSTLWAQCKVYGVVVAKIHISDDTDETQVTSKDMVFFLNGKTAISFNCINMMQGLVRVKCLIPAMGNSNAYHDMSFLIGY